MMANGTPGWLEGAPLPRPAPPTPATSCRSWGPRTWSATWSVSEKRSARRRSPSSGFLWHQHRCSLRRPLSGPRPCLRPRFRPARCHRSGDILPEWVDAIERTFDAYLADCAAALICPFHSGGDPAAAFDALMAEVDAAPLEVSTETGTRLVGQRAVLDAVDASLSWPSQWPRLAPLSPRPPAATAPWSLPSPISATNDHSTAPTGLATRCSWPLAVWTSLSPKTQPPIKRWLPRRQ